ncbi:TetR/AcrR family transcriptional regulator [Cellulomonas rhizosphaerae]|uniref:TetR/AcrR family transcriptional regulator n=1 Tax=Cellulomonas rhizosphaerae TaxID=2293719 RepID=A0A413RHU9_9CELL|nr:TetR/AcrR family transcriptional regulator [Cellulomonas rhizosphaerae]RHA37765.1 TetR/AcrR family transcriptional regulator [Cellulomonas rhizosphaerae]
MTAYDEDVLAAAPARRPGRRRDDSKDDVILEAARQLIAERGYEGMTMDAVAERAGTGKATVYRRWPSKVELTVDAVICGRPLLTIDDVPDTGSLRSDLLATRGVPQGTRNDELMHGLHQAAQADPQVAAVFHEQFVAARTALMRGLLERAKERGEIAPGRDLDMIATVAPAMIAYQKVVAGKKVGPEFIERMIDTIILPLATGTTPLPTAPGDPA